MEVWQAILTAVVVLLVTLLVALEMPNHLTKRKDSKSSLPEFPSVLQLLIPICSHESIPDLEFHEIPGISLINLPTFFFFPLKKARMYL